MKTINPSTHMMIHTSEEFTQCVPANFPHFLERSSKLIRRILQDMGQWSDNMAHEKLLLRLSFNLVEKFIEYCPSQLPCRPLLLLDGYISKYFGRPQEHKAPSTSNQLMYRFLDGLLNRAVISRDALIGLFYHLYGLRPREVRILLGIEEEQMQRIYKNFRRWKQKGWYLAMEEADLTENEIKHLHNSQIKHPEIFNTQARENLEILLPFYRKSDPPHYPCLTKTKWREVFTEGYGYDYKMWHLPLCLTCLHEVAGFGDDFCLPTDLRLNLHISPYSVNEEEVSFQQFKRSKIRGTCTTQRHHVHSRLQVA
ncbi:MAG: hypothetical protein NPIRA01_02400 [Nitrospirales bacterium]|nr:MAG: hypothetical protein NPIRA01_02400 [Nitrospirales bacterium]